MASKLDLLYHFSTNYLIPAAFPHMWVNVQRSNLTLKPISVSQRYEWSS
jgi:hypothetical protein